MKRIAIITSLAAMLVLAGGITAHYAQAGMAMPKPITVTGTLVDAKCFSMNPMKNKGNDHVTPKGEMPSCATACASMGIPAAVVDSSGKVVVLIAPAKIFAPHMAKTARITGAPALDGHGIVAKKAEVKDGGNWKEIQITTMM